MILLLVSSIVLTFVGLAIVLNVLKHKNKSDSLKIAFFHPFWYFFCHIVMTEEAAKKSFGAFLMPYSMIKTTKMFLKLRFIVWFRTKVKFFRKSKYHFHIFRADSLWTWQDFMIRFKSFMFLARISWFLKRNLPWSFIWFCLSFMPLSVCSSTNQMFFMTQQVLHQHFFSQKFCFQPQKPRLMSITLSLVSIWFRKSKKEEATSIMTQGKIYGKFSISNSPIKTKLKLFYYQTIFFLYKFNGFFVDFAQTNSSWTHNHMCQIWTGLNSKYFCLYQETNW